MVSNPKLGNKHVCKECDTRFFDMKKNPPACPNCGLEIKAPKPAKARRPVSAPTKPVAEKPIEEKREDGENAETKTDGTEIDKDLEALLPTDDGDSDEDALDDDEDDGKLIKGASDLGGADDDLQEVREHIDDGSTDKG